MGSRSEKGHTKVKVSRWVKAIVGNLQVKFELIQSRRFRTIASHVRSNAKRIPTPSHLPVGQGIQYPMHKPVLAGCEEMAWMWWRRGYD